MSVEAVEQIARQTLVRDLADGGVVSVWHWTHAFAERYDASMEEAHAELKREFDAGILVIAEKGARCRCCRRASSAAVQATTHASMAAAGRRQLSVARAPRLFAARAREEIERNADGIGWNGIMQNRGNHDAQQAIIAEGLRLQLEVLLDIRTAIGIGVQLSANAVDGLCDLNETLQDQRPASRIVTAGGL